MVNNDYSSKFKENLAYFRGLEKTEKTKATEKGRDDKVPHPQLAESMPEESANIEKAAANLNELLNGQEKPQTEQTWVSSDLEKLKKRKAKGKEKKDQAFSQEKPAFTPRAPKIEEGKITEAAKENPRKVNEKVQEKASEVLKGETPHTAKSSQTEENYPDSLGWRLYKKVTIFLPRFLAKPFQRFSISKGLIRIEDLEPQMIVKLSPQNLRNVSDNCLRAFTRDELKQFDRNQIFALGPDRIVHLFTAENAAFLINRLDEDGSSGFLRRINSLAARGKVKPEYLKDFHNSLFEGNKMQRIVLAYQQDMIDESELISFYDGLEGFIKETFLEDLAHAYREKLDALRDERIKAPPDYLQDLLRPRSKARREEELLPTESTAAELVGEDVTLLHRFREDSKVANYTVNGQDVSLDDMETEDRWQPVLAAIHESSQDAELTNALQVLLHQGSMREMNRIGQNEVYGFQLQLEEGLAPVVMSLPQDMHYSVSIDDETEMVHIRMRNAAQIALVDGEEVGWAIQETRISISTEDLKTGETENAKAFYLFSPVFKDKEEALAYEHRGEGVHLEPAASYPDRKVRGRSKVIENALRVDLSQKQERLEKQLAQRFDPVDSVKWAALSIQIEANRLIDMSETAKEVTPEMEEMLKEGNPQEHLLEHLKEKFEDNPHVLKVIEAAEQVKEDNPALSNSAALNRVYKSIIPEMLAPYVAPQGDDVYYGTYLGTREHARAFNADKDQVEEMVLVALEEFTERDQEAIRQRVYSQIDALEQRSKDFIEPVREYVEGDAKPLFISLEADIIKAIEEAKNNGVKRLSEDTLKTLVQKHVEDLRNNYIEAKLNEAAAEKDLSEKDKLDLEEKILASYHDEETGEVHKEILLGDLFEEVIIYSAPIVNFYPKRVEKQFNNYLPTYFDTPINFPKKSKEYTDQLLERIFSLNK